MKVLANWTWTVQLDWRWSQQPKGELMCRHVTLIMAMQNELQHIWLSKHGRQEIASKIQQGVPADKILDDIRQSMPESL